ncbi:MAG: hypothetical protein WBZ36_09535 [Candidatus Nitrosopolaris sp.]
MRVPYYCPYCDQRSTRRWNLDVHIKRRHGGYLLGRSSDQYMANNPLYSKNVQFGHATVTASVGETFQPRYISQQIPLDVMQYSANPMYPPTQIMDGHVTGLSQGAVQKIQEFKRLMNKYPQYHENPDGILRLAIYNSINGDNTLLNNKLEQLRTIDSLANNQLRFL